MNIQPLKRQMTALDREAIFQDLVARFAGLKSWRAGRSFIVNGDSLDLLSKIPDKSVNLIVTDPPYHSTKKKNITGDRNFDSDSDFLEWMNLYFKQFKRILAPNGSLYIFCSSAMAPYLYVDLAGEFTMHNTIAWSKPNRPGYDGWKQKMNKTALRSWYPHSERIIFCSPAYDGNLKRSFLGQYLREIRQQCGMTSNELTYRVGAFGKVNNGGAVSNWETGRNVPSRDQWARIATALLATGRIDFVLPYEDAVRAFNVDPEEEFTDIWDFENVRQYKGKHPAEKPMDLLQHIIRTSSYENDIVLDCFMGSGSTLRAARALGRFGIGLEIEADWCGYAATALQAAG